MSRNKVPCSLTGQHLKLSEKVAFQLSQKELRKVINPDGTVNVKKLESLNKKMQKAAADNKKNLRLALIFLGAAIVLSIIGSFVPFVWILASLAYLDFCCLLHHLADKHWPNKQLAVSIRF